MHTKLKILAAAKGLTLDSLMTEAAEMYIHQNSKYIRDVFTDWGYQYADCIKYKYPVVYSQHQSFLNGNF